MKFELSKISTRKPLVVFHSVQADGLHVTASSNRSLNTLLEVEVPAEWDWLPSPQPSVKYLETLAKILDLPANSRYLLKPLIRSCLFLLDTKLLKFLTGILVRVLSRVSRK